MSQGERFPPENDRVEFLGMSLAGIGLGIAWVWPFFGLLWAGVAIAVTITGLGMFALAPQIRQAVGGAA